MATTTSKPSPPNQTIEAFSDEEITNLPPDGDIEIQLIPKQIVRFQNASTASDATQVQVKVNPELTNFRHYNPSTKQTSASTNLPVGQLEEFWAPRSVDGSIHIKLKGSSGEQNFKLPSELCGPEEELSVFYSELSKRPLSTGGFEKTKKIPAGKNALGEDYFVFLHDNQAILKQGHFTPGIIEIDSLSNEQKTLLEAFLKEAIEGNTIVPAAGQVYDQFPLLRDFASNGRFRFQITNGKTYIIFNGNKGLRRVFRGSRYLLDKNYAQFSMLTVKQGLKGAVKSAIPSASRGSIVGFAFVGAMDTYDWIKTDSGFLTDLLIQLGSDIIQMILSAIVSASIVCLMILGGAPIATVTAIITATIFIGIGVGIGIGALDEMWEVTESTKIAGRMATTKAKNVWQKTVVTPIGDFLEECENALISTFYLGRFP
jgi:hypothetical protein